MHANAARLLRQPGGRLWASSCVTSAARDQSWVFFGRNDAKAETPILGHLMQRVDSVEKTLMLGGTGGRRKRGQTTEDEMAGWHHRLDGHEYG